MNALRQIRKLTILLMLSGGLNLVLFSVLSYGMMKETVPTPYFELKPATEQEAQLPLALDHSNSDVIRYLRILPTERLVARLNQAQLIENGYTLRDLALACLVDLHHFDLERALNGFAKPDQKRTLVYGKKRNGKNAELSVYPGLSDQQFQAIVTFATTEKWPLTSKGLFLALRKQKTQNPSLSDAFFMTPEFLAVETLLGRAEVPVEKNDVLAFLLQGDFETLSSFVLQQRLHQDLSSARRQSFLLDYIQHKSSVAAKVLLKTDPSFAIRKLNDVQVIQILRLLNEKSIEGEKFAIALLTSPRSDDVWKAAAERLYAYAGEVMPQKYHHHAALSRFVSQSTIVSLPDAEIGAGREKATLGERKQLFASQPAATPSTSSKKTNVPVVSEVKLPTLQAKIKPSLAKSDSSSLSVKSKEGTRLSSAILSQKLSSSALPPNALSQNRRQERFYVVQEGDSLWKISRRFNVDVEQIKANNRLDSDVLKPGRPLIIP